MTMVPRFAERVLGALGACSYLRDDVLGDLAEEYAVRAEFGVTAARRWYYREALRAAPHLLRSGIREVRGRELVALGRTVVLSLLSVMVFGEVFFTVVKAVRSAFGLQLPLVPPFSWVTAPLFLLVNAIRPMVGGYIAAAIHRRAPLLGAVALGLVWLGLDFVAIARHGGTFPALYRYGAPLVLIASIAAGALLRACRSPVQLR